MTSYLLLLDLIQQQTIITIIVMIHINIVNPRAILPAITIEKEDCIVSTIVGVGVSVDIVTLCLQISSLKLFKGTGHVGSNVTRTGPLVTLAPFNTHSSIHDTI